MACTGSPLCQLWLLQLPLLVFSWCSCWPNICCFGKQRCSKCRLFLCWHILAGGDQRGPLDSAPASPSLLQVCSHLRNFPQSGQGDPGAFHSNMSQQLWESQRVPQSPAQPSAPAWHQDWGSHSHSRTGSAVSQLQPEGFSPHPCPGLWDECGGALEQMMGLGAAHVSGASRKEPQGNTCSLIISIPGLYFVKQP